jgi:uncharacterized protein
VNIAPPFGIGIAIGLVLGTLGAGGAILTVPALVTVERLSAYEAGTVALLVVTATAAAGLIPRPNAPRVDTKVGLTFGAVGLPAAWAGSRLAPHIAPHVLMAAFAALMVTAAARMVRRAGGTSPTTRGRGNPLYVVAAAAGVGLLTGLLGVGGGFLIVPALVLTLGLPMPQATRTSLLVITVNGIGAVAGRADQLDTLPWGLVGLLVVGALLGGALGVWLAARIDPVGLTRGFACLLLLAALAAAGGAR